MEQTQGLTENNTVADGLQEYLTNLDYVVEHEVAHLDVQDHSQRYWRLLASRCPEWRDHEAWLRKHGHALRL